MKQLDEWAHRAAEEFLAAGRAETAEEQQERRARALAYLALREERRHAPPNSTS